MNCPSVSANGLTCDREDTMVAHMSLLHRNDEACREWYITPLDRVRWGVVGPKKTRGAKVKPEEAEGESDGQEADLGPQE